MSTFTFFHLTLTFFSSWFDGLFDYKQYSSIKSRRLVKEVKTRLSSVNENDDKKNLAGSKSSHRQNCSDFLSQRIQYSLRAIIWLSL